MTNSISILSIDDHEAVSAGLRDIVQSTHGLVWCGSVDTLEAAVPAVAHHMPDIVLLDLFVRGERAWGTCADLAQEADGPAVAIYSAHGNAHLLDRARQLGANGYVLKSTPLRDMPKILRGISDSGSWWQPDLYRQWQRACRTDEVQLFTPRELEIIQLVAEGHDNASVAEALFISPHTVKYHLGKALRRTGEASRSGLVRRALQDHLIGDSLPDG